MDYALSHPQFGLHELYSYLDKEGNKDISHKTVSWYLTKLIESGKLQRVARGKTTRTVVPPHVWASTVRL